MVTSQEHVPSGAKKHWYDRTYKLLLVFPIVLFVSALLYLGFFYYATGNLFNTDVSITGGTTITVFTEREYLSLVESITDQFPDASVRGISDIRTGAQKGFYVETTASVDEVKPFLESLLGFTLTNDNSSIEFTDTAISSSFYKQLISALVIAFICMAIVVFLVFRSFVPSAAVVFAAFADIVMTIAVVNLLGMDISLAGIVALLMLIGYSVDTDILLTSKVLKKGEGSVNHRIFESFKTGMTMTLTAIAAITVSLIVTFSISPVLKQIFSITLIGLGFDILNTWLTNASMLKWYTEVKKKP